VSRYVTLVPTDSSNETSVYMLEQYVSSCTCIIKTNKLRYKDQAASDSHLQQPPVQKLLKFFGDESPLVAPPEVFNLNPTIDVRRPITDPKDGMIFLFAHMGYKEGKLSSAVSILKDLISACEKAEPGFYGCTASADKENNLIRIVDMFESEKFYEEEHVKSEPIAKFHQQNTPLASGDFSLVKLKVVQGFLGR
jgi:quinol monooxygenase YgiN